MSSAHASATTATTSPVSDEIKARLENMTLEEFPGTPASANSTSHYHGTTLHHTALHHATLQNGHTPVYSTATSSMTNTTILSSPPEQQLLEENVITASSSVMMTTTGAPVDPEDLEEAQRQQPGRLRRPSKSSLAELQNQITAQQPPSDIIPTAIVIKNIPFAMKRDQLISLLDELRVPQPYALNYHFENGAFRGLAFANFRTSQEADAVVARLDGHEVMGRKIKVEYKKVLPPEEAARKEAERRASIAALNDRVMEFDLNDPATRQLYDKMVAFRDDKLRNELIFAKSITGPERKLVRAIGQKLGFFYRTEDNGEERFFKVTRRPSVSVNKVNLKEMELDRLPRKYSLTTQQTRPDLSQIIGPSAAAMPGGVAGPAAERLITRGTRSLSLSARDQPAFLRSAALRKNSFLSQTPPPGFNALRQPKGPDAAANFQNTVGRKPSLNPGAIPFDTLQTDPTMVRKRDSRTLDLAVDSMIGVPVSLAGGVVKPADVPAPSHSNHGNPSQNMMSVPTTNV